MASANGIVSPSSARAAAVSISSRRVHDDGRQSGWYRQLDDVERMGMADEHEAAADCRHDVIRMRRSSAQALAFERARDQHVARRMCVREAHRRRRRRRRRLPRCRRGRSPAAAPCESSGRCRARRRALVRSACAATPAVLRIASRGSRPSSPAMSSIGDAALDETRTVTSSPGPSMAKPSASNPQPTFDTVAGANAVTDRMGDPYYSGASADLPFVAQDLGPAWPPPDLSAVAFADGRNQIFAERPVEVVRRGEAPVGARGGVVHVGRPRVDDALPLLVDLERDRRASETPA